MSKIWNLKTNMNNDIFDDVARVQRSLKVLNLINYDGNRIYALLEEEIDNPNRVEQVVTRICNDHQTFPVIIGTVPGTQLDNNPIPLGPTCSTADCPPLICNENKTNIHGDLVDDMLLKDVEKVQEVVPQISSDKIYQRLKHSISKHRVEDVTHMFLNEISNSDGLLISMGFHSSPTKRHKPEHEPDMRRNVLDNQSISPAANSLPASSTSSSSVGLLAKIDSSPSPSKCCKPEHEPDMKRNVLDNQGIAPVANFHATPSTSSTFLNTLDFRGFEDVVLPKANISSPSLAKIIKVEHQPSVGSNTLKSRFGLLAKMDSCPSPPKRCKPEHEPDMRRIVLDNQGIAPVANFHATPSTSSTFLNTLDFRGFEDFALPKATTSSSSLAKSIKVEHQPSAGSNTLPESAEDFIRAYKVPDDDDDVVFVPTAVHTANNVHSPYQKLDILCNEIFNLPNINKDDIICNSKLTGDEGACALPLNTLVILQNENPTNHNQPPNANVCSNLQRNLVRNVEEELPKNSCDTGLVKPNVPVTPPIDTVDLTDALTFCQPAISFEDLEDILPHVDPTYLHQKFDSVGHDQNAIMAFVADALDSNDLPSRKDYEKRIKEEKIGAKERELREMLTKRFDLQTFLDMFPDTVTHFEKNTVSVKPAGEARNFMMGLYLRIRCCDLDPVLKRLDYKLVQVCKELDAFQGYRRAPRKGIEVKQVNFDLLDTESLQVMAFLKHKDEITKYLEEKKTAKNVAFEQAKAKHEFVNCDCCFDDELLFEDAVACEDGHLFCRECVLRGAEAQIGQGKATFPCLTECTKEFSVDALQSLLNQTVFLKVMQQRSAEEVKAANIENFETCPFCDFGIVLSPENNIFTCLNPDCMKDSCRLCKAASHIPYRCDELEKPTEVKMRVYIEDKMTEALVRTCWKCSKKFIKEDGCNKMTCTCGALMCYLCRQPVKDYTHFNGQGGEDYHKCALFSNNDLLHVTDVTNEAIKAKEEMTAQNPTMILKHDPTEILPQTKKVAAVGVDELQIMQALPRYNVPVPIVPAPAQVPAARALAVNLGLPARVPVVAAPVRGPVVPAPVRGPVVPAPVRGPVVPAPVRRPVVPAPVRGPVVPAPAHVPATPVAAVRALGYVPAAPVQVPAAPAPAVRAPLIRGLAIRAPTRR